MARLIRVAVVQSDPLFLKGLVRALCSHDDIEITGRFTNASDKKIITSLRAADVLLIDAEMPGGPMVVGRSAYSRPSLKIIMLIASMATLPIVWVTQAMAHGWLLKNVTGDDLVEAIRHVFAGSLFVSPELSARIGAENGRLVGNANLNMALSGLTPREMQIMLHVSHGLQNKEVAELIGLSEPTVRSYMTRIMRKLEVSNRSTAAMIVSRNQPS